MRCTFEIKVLRDMFFWLQYAWCILRKNQGKLLRKSVDVKSGNVCMEFDRMYKVRTLKCMTWTNKQDSTSHGSYEYAWIRVRTSLHWSPATRRVPTRTENPGKPGIMRRHIPVMWKCPANGMPRLDKSCLKITQSITGQRLRRICDKYYREIFIYYCHCLVWMSCVLNFLKWIKYLVKRTKR